MYLARVPNQKSTSMPTQTQSVVRCALPLLANLLPRLPTDGKAVALR